MDEWDSRRWCLTAAALGVAVGILLAAFSFEAPAPPGSSTVVVPSGRTWTLTPPATWCTTTPLVGGGVEYSCSVSGAATFPLNVTKPSRLSGVVEVDGPFSIWIFFSGWSCEIGVQVTGFHHSCPIPYDPPDWGTWSTSSAGAGPLNLSSLPLNWTSSTGIIPPTNWEMWIVDAQGTNETLTVTTPIVLSG